MKEFIVEFTETVTYKTIIEAESESEAQYKFLEGDFNECDELYREYDGDYEPDLYDEDCW